MYRGLFGGMLYWFITVPVAILFVLTGSPKAAGWLLAGRYELPCPLLSLLTELFFLRIPGFLLLLAFDPKDALSVLFTGSAEPVFVRNPSHDLAPPLAY